MKKITVLLTVLAALVLNAGHPEFVSDVTGDKKPWTNENFPNISADGGNFVDIAVEYCREFLYGKE